jgi:hypothetical protein
MDFEEEVQAHINWIKKYLEEARLYEEMKAEEVRRREAERLWRKIEEAEAARRKHKTYYNQNDDASDDHGSGGIFSASSASSGLSGRSKHTSASDNSRSNREIERERERERKRETEREREKVSEPEREGEGEGEGERDRAFLATSDSHHEARDQHAAGNTSSKASASTKTADDREAVRKGRGGQTSASPPVRAAAGAQYTCFTSTNVHILTPDAGRTNVSFSSSSRRSQSVV